MTPTQKDTEMEMEMEQGTVYYGDCADHLTQWCNWNSSHPFARILADLIYLDPPWNSNAKYNILWGKKANREGGHTEQETAFTDIWHWTEAAHKRVKYICDTRQFPFKHDTSPYHPARQSIRALNDLIPETGILAYVSYMAERLALLKLMLKETGSIYLHCDPTASHYLKLVMDNIFGVKNFRNEIVWCYPPGGKAPKYGFHRKYDVILYYSKGDKPRFNHQFRHLTDAQIKKFSKTDKDGRKYKEYRGKTRTYLDDMLGSPVPSWWTDIPSLGQTTSKECTRFPTQKPLALLKRIIKASSNEGDLVLDPFCGCGTAVVAAEQLKRKFVGIDISLFAVETVTYDRLKEIGRTPEIKGIPKGMAAARRLAKDDPFAFETWAVETCHPGFVANKHQRKDGGIDGKGVLLYPVKENGEEKDLVLVQVKAGKPNIDQVLAFDHKIQRTKGAIAGVFITLEEDHWTRDMDKVAKQAGKFKHPQSATKYPRLQHWHIKQNDDKLNDDEAMWAGFPILPELSHPLSGKELTIKQPLFWHRI